MRLAIWDEPSKRVKGAGSLRYHDPLTGKKAPRQYYRNKLEREALKLKIKTMLLGWKGGTDASEAIPLVLFEDYLLDLVHAGRRKSTLLIKRQSLTAFLESIFQLKQLDKPRIETWVRDLHKKYSIDTVSLRMRDLRAFLRWMVHKGYLQESPFQGLTIPQSTFVGRRLSIEEIQRIYDASSGLLQLFITLALDTGARLSEIVHMEWTEIDLEQRSWFIPAHKCKTRINRTIPLTSRAVNALIGIPKAGNKPFGTWTRYSVKNAWKRALRRSGVQGRVRIHDLRHTWASNWKGRAASLRSIAGWTTDLMASKYTHTELDYLAEDANRTSEGIWGRFGDNVPKSDNSAQNGPIDKL